MAKKKMPEPEKKFSHITSWESALHKARLKCEWKEVLKILDFNNS